jgi:hypothetical protein
VAIGDQQGTLTLIDTESATCLFSGNVNSGGSLDPLTCLTFTEAVMNEQDYDLLQQKQADPTFDRNRRIPLEPLLFIGSESGQVCSALFTLLFP